MAKLSKADLKVQKEIQELLWSSDSTLINEWGRPDIDKIEYIYENYDPSYDDNITERGVFFTPIGLAQDTALFSPKSGARIVDVCSGISMLSYKLICMNYYNTPIKSITMIEYNPKFTEIAMKLLTPLSAYNESHSVIELNFITADAFLKSTWDNATSTLPLLANGKFDLMISNPPYGKLSATDKALYTDHLKYTGERELMAVELCTKYANHGMFILPPMSSEVGCSGREYWRKPSIKVDRLRKAMGEDVFIYMECESIDCSIYREDWKNVKITTEVVSINLDRSEYS